MVMALATMNSAPKLVLSSYYCSNQCYSDSCYSVSSLFFVCLLVIAVASCTTRRHTSRCWMEHLKAARESFQKYVDSKPSQIEIPMGDAGLISTGFYWGLLARPCAIFQDSYRWKLWQTTTFLKKIFNINVLDPHAKEGSIYHPMTKVLSQSCLLVNNKVTGLRLSTDTCTRDNDLQLWKPSCCYFVRSAPDIINHIYRSKYRLQLNTNPFFYILTRSLYNTIALAYLYLSLMKALTHTEFFSLEPLNH